MSEFRPILDERGNVIPGYLKNKYGMIVSSNSLAIQKYKNEKVIAEIEAKDKAEMKRRLSDVESSLSEIKEILYKIMKKDDK